MSRVEAFRRVQQELRQAQAEALGRTGERLGAVVTEQYPVPPRRISGQPGGAPGSSRT